MTETAEVVLIDLEPVSLLIGEGIATLRSLDGARVQMTNNPARADVRRELIYLADVLDRAATEARAVYHRMNGKTDVLEDLR